MKNSMYEVAIGLAKTQTELIDSFTEDAVLTSREIPFQASTHGIKNVFEKVKEVKGPKIVDLDAPMPLITAVTELGETPLFKIGGTMELPKDLVETVGNGSNSGGSNSSGSNSGGGSALNKYLRRKIPLILKEAGRQLDVLTYYDVLLGTAIKNKRVINKNSSASASQKQYFSLVAVHWSRGEVCGLYNDNRDNKGQNGSFFQQTPLWGGSVGRLTDGATGWAIDLTAMLGYQIAKPEYLKAFVNIDETNLPTYEELIGIANAIRGNGANSRIYANPNLIDMIAAKYTRAAGENSYSSLITVDTNGDIRIKGIPVIGDWNILSGDEPGIPSSELE